MISTIVIWRRHLLCLGEMTAAAENKHAQ